MTKDMIFSKIIFLIVTILGIGKVKFAPGTFGSIVAFPLAFIIIQSIAILDFSFYFIGLTLQENYLITIPIILVIASFIIFIIGWICSEIYIQNKKNHDPSEVVIDELSGQMLTIALTLPSMAIVMDSNMREYLNEDIISLVVCFILPFSLFRLFDITKPWPIKNVEQNFKNGFGIMIDDTLAAIFASIIHYTIIFILLDLITVKQLS